MKQKQTQYHGLAAEDRAAIRREKVRLNVKAFRERKKMIQQGHRDSTETEIKCSSAVELRWIPEKTLEALCVNNHRNRAPEKTPNATKSAEMIKKEANQISTMRPCPMLEFNLEKEDTSALIDDFRSRFLPCHQFMPPLTCALERSAAPCASWITRAFNIAFYKERAVVRAMMRSIALGLIAIEDCREDVKRKSLDSYQTSLVAVRRYVVYVGKKRLDPADFLALLLSCHVAAMYELAVNVSLVDMIRHVDGITALILHQISGHSHLPETFYDLIEEFRVIEMCFCLPLRRISLLTNFKNRTNRAGADGHSLRTAEKNTSYMGGLIDIADRICTVMVKFDGLKPFKETGHTTDALREVVGDAYNILDTLKTWKEDFLAVYGSSICNLGYHHSSTKSLEFFSLPIAATWAYGLAYKLYALDILISAQIALSEIGETDGRLSHARWIPGQDSLAHAAVDMLDTARLLLRSLPWFYQQDIGITGRTLSILPLGAVNHAFCNDIWQDLVAVNVHFGCNDTPTTSSVPLLLSRDLAMYEEMALRAKACGLPIVSEQLFQSLETSSTGV
ncbi:uncharacterized protein A1O9_05674 [Exophiala aquamarina CBS 119918]|uniref:Uncharacterized protein n=1 Tax=Exophiala aquamarina CBS 119918 TaxID=1182545 RepID=A0A072PCE7_9EURO|nr:uncharacterized protein A1O9_05674 [Exophiala aquamarina CBS 119918]KEF57754.1 hypothetical protein A1O9_05674 [Exophiala aquamarina CBS 119918]